MKRKSQQGVALVVTLILLSVITFLAIAFLALSTRERGAVSTTTDLNIAQLAARNAFERAQAEIMANILARSNKFSYGILVPTNYDNPNGFDPSVGASPLNVNYEYTTTGARLSPANYLQNLANLQYDPRPPVYIRTNQNQVAPPEFRYYWDLNRNGLFEPSGWQPVLNAAGIPTTSLSNGVIVTNFAYVTGDPAFVGDLSRSDMPHSAVNQFVDRWTFFVVPAGKALDINAIYNQNRLFGRTLDGFFRNQGVGTWENNLAALFRDLNTNVWTLPFDYGFDGRPNQGPAFKDAISVLLYRYALSSQTLLSMQQYLGPAPAQALSLSPVDWYAAGPLTALNAPVPPLNYAVTSPWPGSDNTNKFFTVQELFDPTKTSTSFATHLLAAGANQDSYNRYTYYRLHEALGSDSAPEPGDMIYAQSLAASSSPALVAARPPSVPKININYVDVAGLGPSNAVSWNALPAGPTMFFTNVADRLLRDPAVAPPYPGLCVTNIPIWPPTNNFYTPSVHRLLQLAANIYDATSADPYPSTFRPVFTVTHIGGVGFVRISGYQFEPNPGFFITGGRNRWQDLSTLSTFPDGPITNVLVYGIPVIVGAKKGFPNFNEAAMQSIAMVSRKMELRKAVAGGPIIETNQMYLVGLTNVVGIEAWNSYAATYPHPLDIYASMDASTLIENEVSLVRTNWFVLPSPAPLTLITNLPAGTWPGYRANAGTASFKIPLAAGYLALPTSVYLQDPSGGGSIASLQSGFQSQRSIGLRVPQLYMATTARVRFMLVDRTAGRVVDFVNLDHLSNAMDLSGALGANSRGTGANATWRTNRINGGGINVPTEGMMWQIQVSLGNVNSSVSDWSSYSMNPISGADKDKAIAAFKTFFDPRLYSPYISGSDVGLSSLAMQTPFNPAGRVFMRTSWQANDPLVHYTAADLTGETNEIQSVMPPTGISTNILLPNVGRLNLRYRPWPVDVTAAAADSDAFNLALKDPMVRNSDDWNFPASKFPGIGWLGRVHRGTPWQTVYLKSQTFDVRSPTLNESIWEKWTGNLVLQRIGNSIVPDAHYSLPTADWAMLDHFTTAINENSTRGQLSVNQSQLAAWSAVFSGVPILTNTSPDTTIRNQIANIFYQPTFTVRPIDPAGDAGLNSPLGIVWAGINRERTRAVTNFVAGKPVLSYVHPDATFWRLGDILSVPELTIASPFLNRSSAVQQMGGLNDAAYERIPQMTLSLLRGDDQPRFVVYVLGQALRPAQGGVLTSGAFPGLCTNYQIMAESAMRYVVRIEGDPKLGQPLRPVVESFNILPPD